VCRVAPTVGPSPVVARVPQAVPSLTGRAPCGSRVLVRPTAASPTTAHPPQLRVPIPRDDFPTPQTHLHATRGTTVANIKSQIKRNRQTITRHERNKAVRTNLKTDLKRFRTAFEEGDASAADEAFRTASRSLDKAATRGIIHANNAANKKSRMARKLASLDASNA